MTFQFALGAPEMQKPRHFCWDLSIGFGILTTYTQTLIHMLHIRVYFVCIYMHLCSCILSPHCSSGFRAFCLAEFESCGGMEKFLTSALKRIHGWHSYFFFFFCFLMKFIQYKDAKDVAANGKVFNFCCSVQLIEIFVCENLWFPPWKQTYIKSFCVFGIYQVWSLNKELRARWTTYLRKVFSAINFKSLFIKGKRHCKSFWTKNLA